MPTHSQWTVEVPTTTQGNGHSDTAIHKSSFPSSPFHNGELTAEGLKRQFAELVQSADFNDGGHTFGQLDRDYREAPNLNDVEVGGGGLPGSPYAPNIASPTEGLDPTTIPSSGVEATERSRGQGSPFPGDALASPDASAATVSAQTVLGSLSYGRSAPKP